MPAPSPEVTRVAIDDHTWRAVESVQDRIEAGRIKTAAVGLIPLQRVQVALDQLARNAEDHRRDPVRGPFTFNFRDYVQAELDGARRHAAVLRCAADAAASMIGALESQLREFTPMAQDDQDKPPVLTTTGEPHPLTQGGYDPAADTHLPGGISPIEALKEGKATPAMAEALAKVDTEGSDPEPARAPETAAAPEPSAAEKAGQVQAQAQTREALTAPPTGAGAPGPAHAPAPGPGLGPKAAPKSEPPKDQGPRRR